MKKIIKQEFYQQKTIKVARQLLGKYLIRKINRQIIIGQILETEAYCGINDLASHASRGRTIRNEIMFGPAGYWYVFLIYGRYYCLNIVTENKNYPAAVLIRAVKLIKGLENNLKTDGPGKLCREFKIDKRINRRTAVKKQSLWIEDWNEKIKNRQIKSATRVGVDYAGAYKNKLWRFYL